jgi:hypothetical protein
MKLPGKKPMFQLNRIDMHLILFYLFLLIILLSLPTFIQQLTTPEGFGAQLNFIFFLIYFFIFHYLPITIALILFLSIVALLGKLFANATNRKLHYGTIWKLTACAATIPFLIYTVITLFYPLDDIYLLLSGLYILILLIKMVLVYPKRKQKKK